MAKCKPAFLVAALLCLLQDPAALARECGDVVDPAGVLASDALAVLKRAVKDPTVTLMCSGACSTWYVNALAGESGGPWWLRGPARICDDGSISATLLEEYDSYPDSFASQFDISPAGVITAPGGDPLFRGARDMGGTVIALTNTWSTGPPSTELMVMTKLALSYETGDIAGTWAVHGLATGSGAPYWGRGTLVVAGDGSFSLDVVDSDGSHDNDNGNLLLPGAGVIGKEDNANFRGVLDLDKSVWVGTSTWNDGSGTTDLTVGVRRAASYVATDLAGTWEIYSLATGVGAPWWGRGLISVASNGSYAGTWTENDGSVNNSYSGTLALSGTGAVTEVGDASFLGNMDSGKTVIASTRTWPSGPPGATELSVWTKMSN